jgi:hypothetical protein
VLTLAFFFQKEKILCRIHTFYFLLSLGRQATIIIRQKEKEKNTAPTSDVSWFEGEKARIIFYCQ